MRTPDPKVMRAIFNDPEALEQLNKAILSDKTDGDNTIHVGNKTYVVRTASSQDKHKR